MRVSMLRSLITMAFLAITSLVFGQGVNNGWQNWYGLQITENAGEEWTDHQVLLNLDLEQLVADGELESDGSDLRFSSDCDGADTLKFWIEDSVFSDTTQVWVLLPTLAANDVKFIYMFCGNPGVAAGSNFDSTFTPASRLFVATGTTFTPVDTNDYSWIEVDTGASITLPPRDLTSAEAVLPLFRARKFILNGDIILDASGELGGDVNGADGAGSGGGPGNALGGAGGGSLGGSGGRGTSTAEVTVVPGGNAFPGGVPADTSMVIGSGGGAAAAVSGGSGGGSIKIHSTVFIQNGNISMNGDFGVGGVDPVPGVTLDIGVDNGQPDPGGAGGGGSGGGIVLISREMVLNGDISANGGDGGLGTWADSTTNDGGGGSGGIIKMFYENVLLSGTQTVVQGTNRGFAPDAQPGVVISENMTYFPSGILLDKIPYPIDFVFDLLHPDSLCLGVEYTYNALFDFTISTFESIDLWVNNTIVSSDPNNTAFLYDGMQDGDTAFFVGNKYGCGVVSDSIIFGVFDLPTVDFEITDIQNEVDFSFEVTASSGNVAAYIWLFGDGTSSSDINPFHTFPGRGSYNTCLIVSDADTKCSSEQVCKPSDVVCSDPDIKYELLYENVDFKIILNDTTLRAQQWAWSLEDGPFVANNSDTVFTYPNDTTGVRFALAVRNHCAWDTLKNLTFDLACAPLVVDYSLVQDQDDPFLYTFIDNSLYTPDDWEIVIGTDTIRNGFPSIPYSFNGPGPFSIEYTAVNACEDSLTDVQLFSPDCPLPVNDWTYVYDANNPFLLHFTSNTNNKFDPNYFWFFDDQQNSQNTTSSQPNPSHLFEDGDRAYSVSLTISNICGTVTETKVVNVCDSIRSNFSYFFGKDNEVEFSNLTYGDASETAWIISTGDTLYTENITYQFPEETGTYSICLRSINVCNDTSITCQEITLCNEITAIFESDFDDRTILLANLSEGDYSRVVWDLGNGVFVENQNFVAYTYPAVDHSYTVCLYLENICGETSSACEFHVVLGIEDEFKLAKFNLYPNPFDDILKLSYPSLDGVGVRIRTVDGRIIKELPSFKGDLQLNTAQWASGVYVIEITNGDASRVEKFVKL
ncbi:MAG: hypothetical protein ACJAY8_000797 [Sphingobacteriales bacterium]